MNFNKNYYGILGISNDSSESQIKKAYYKLSFIHHPDKGGDKDVFSEITEAYDVLMDGGREEYDLRSKFGLKYDESKELLDFEFENINVGFDNEKLTKKWDLNELNIFVKIDEDFDGSIEYERWVICKKCEGLGRDTSSKIQIKDENGNVLKIFDGSDGCDFCEGTGKDPFEKECGFCNGERRILGKQRLENIKLNPNEKSTKVESMGHFDKFQVGMVGHLILSK